MPVFREDVDVFFDKFVKVSAGGAGDASIWAVGSHQGNLIMTVVEHQIEELTPHNIVDKPAFFTLDDFRKFYPYWEYDWKAFEEAEKLAKSRQ